MMYYKYLIKNKRKLLLYTCVLFIIVLYWVRSKSPSKTPVILWWTSFINNSRPRYITCEINTCIVTENRDYFNKPETVVLLFYGSTFNKFDLPLPRNYNQIWAVIHEESPKNVPIFLGPETWKLFNYTSTFSRYSHFPITLHYAPNVEKLLNKEYFLNVKEKNKLLDKISPVLYIQSDCETPLERDAYVIELMQYIQIDSYGTCLHNKELPESLKTNHLNNLYSDELLHFVGQYKFVISFENARCNDYITEKYWRPLIAGSVPIYLGSPTIKDWLPNSKSAILVDEYNTPKDLAKYLIEINNNDDLYDSYLEHKISGVVKNQFLLDSLMNIGWKTDSQYQDNDYNEDDKKGMHFFQAFECFLCDNYDKKPILTLPYKMYECPNLVSPLTNEENTTNWWNYFWREGKCEAMLLNKYMMKGTMDQITKEMFEWQLYNMMHGEEESC